MKKSSATAYIVYLLIASCSGFFLLFITKFTFIHLNNKLQLNITNEKARVSIGQVISNKLLKIEALFFQLAPTTNIHGQKRIVAQAESEIKEIEHLFSILEKGGKVNTGILLNIPDLPMVFNKLEYAPPNDGKAILEIVELRPKLLDLGKHLRRLASLVETRSSYRNKSKSAEGEEARQLANMANKTALAVKKFLMPMPPLFVRMKEEANRLVYIANLALKRISTAINDRQQTYFIVEIVIIVFTVFTVIVLLYSISRKMVQLTAKSQKLAVEALQASRAKSEFLANMSHEIRTPMNAMVGYGQLLANSALTQKQKNHLDMIISSGDLLLGIINNILDVSKFEAGKIVFEEIDFDLDHLCQDVFKMILPKIRNATINTYVRIDDDIPLHLKGDPTRLRQLLINLLGNAIKFTKAGEIGIEINNNTQAPPEPGRAALLVQVKDTGIGIPEGKVAAIFKAFTQSDESTTRKYGGTGLGLTICKKIVKAMGGDIWVESEEGKGSNFMFSLNLPIIDSKPIAASGTLIVKRMHGKRLIMVNDHDRTQKILGQCCKHLGIEVVQSFDRTRDALEALVSLAEKGQCPDLVLTDILMPYMSGFELAEKIRSHPLLTRLKIIAISSDIHIEESSEFQQCRFDGILQQPISKQDVLITLTSAFNKVRRNKPRPAPKPIPAQKCKGMRILVAEDNEVNQLLIRELLELQGIQVEIAGNGKEAVDMVKANGYDLCLMDIHMPVMSGIEATRAIRREVSEDFPIIALSAAVMREDIEKGYEAGMNDYLHKPIEMDKLKKAIVKWQSKNKEKVLQ